VKTSTGRRTIDLDTGTVDVLAAWRIERAEERGSTPPGEELVFTKPDGTWIHPQTFSQILERKVAQLDVPRISRHDLRHTHATLMTQGRRPREGRERAPRPRQRRFHHERLPARSPRHAGRGGVDLRRLAQEPGRVESISSSAARGTRNVRPIEMHGSPDRPPSPAESRRSRRCGRSARTPPPHRRSARQCGRCPNRHRPQTGRDPYAPGGNRSVAAAHTRGSDHSQSRCRLTCQTGSLELEVADRTSSSNAPPTSASPLCLSSPVAPFAAAPSTTVRRCRVAHIWQGATRYVRGPPGRLRPMQPAGGELLRGGDGRWCVVGTRPRRSCCAISELRRPRPPDVRGHPADGLRTHVSFEGLRPSPTLTGRRPSKSPLPRSPNTQRRRGASPK
jgi:hypothetical protein